VTAELLEHVACNLCGADDPETIYPSQRQNRVELSPDEFRSSGDEPLRDPLVRCRRCGLQYVTPRLNSAVVIDGYANAVDETFVSQTAGRERTFSHCLNVVQKVWRKPPGRILDIGAANGSFLKVARDAGWEVSGCEPNRWMVQWCRNHYDLAMTAGTVFEGQYASASFDVVTLWDVLEHTPDPMAVLTECQRLLRPGGLLVVNYPDIGSLVARAMGRKWVFLLSIHHYYFTPTTIARALQTVGMRPLIIRRHFQTLELDYILFRATPYVGVIAKTLRKLVNALRLGRQFVPYWVGQTLVIAQKAATG
jgi:SAM-dependent methyltransferase